MSKLAQPINDRCPLQSECERKRCDYKFREKECNYYIGNARPGAEIGDQASASDYAEWEEEILASASEEDSDKELPAEQASGVTDVPSGLMMPLPVDKLIPHPDNPRKELGDLTELADSIKANGIFQNLTVVPADADLETFTVVIGHRRLAAAKLAGLKEVPCVIANMDAKEQVRTMLLENMQRSDLTVYEQAQGFQMMLDMGDSVEEIAAKSGFSKTTVRRRVKMLELDQGTLKEVSERQLSLTDFDELAKIEDTKARNACLAEIGTANFNQTVTTQLRQQAIKKKLSPIKKQLKSSKAKALKQSDTWSGKYESLNAEIIIPDWDGESRVIPEKVSGQAACMKLQEKEASAYEAEHQNIAEWLMREMPPFKEAKQLLELVQTHFSLSVRYTQRPKVIVLGSGFPEELIHAFGITPYWVLGGSLQTGTWAGELAPRDADPVSRSILGLMSGLEKLAQGALILLPIVSDSTRKLAYLLRREGLKVHTIDIPPVKNESGLFR